MTAKAPGQSLELLAPAGSAETFFAALEAGADAVYCGLHEFSARAKARNFTLAEMDRLTSYAHQRGRRLFVTLNTLIKEAELPRLVEVLAGLAACRVDALIVQDLGVWRLVRDHFPDLPLHASTQMTVHNAAGVAMLDQMGFTRAVLARELSLTEIAAIAGGTRLELEHFIHGALCFSISGQCFFSSYLTGKSGNRGRCAQPCRRRYRTRGESGFYFSTSDLCAIDLVPQLAAAGVKSFKIEGRMKNAEYVTKVVKAYRLVMDAQPAEMARAAGEARELLAQAFGRQTTTGFLRGRVPADIVITDSQGGIGNILGTVEQIRGEAVCFTTAEVLHVGDRLRIQPESDLAGRAFTVKEIVIGKRPAKRAEPASFVLVSTPFRGLFKVGDRVYKVSTGKTFAMSEEGCGRLLATASPPPERVQVVAGLAGSCLWLEAEVAGRHERREYEVATQPADRSPLSRKTLQGVFAATGHDDLALDTFTVAGDLPPVVIAPSRLKEIRRDFYRHLAAHLADDRQQRQAQRLAAVLAALPAPQPPRPPQQARLSVIAGLRRQSNLLSLPDVGRLILPLTGENIQAAAKQRRELAPHRQRIVWDVPAMIFEEEWREYRTAIARLIGEGYTLFRLNNLGHFKLFDRRPGLTLLAGPLLYVMNSQAALALHELGVREVTLSIEDDRHNLADILARDLKAVAGITVYGPIPLLTSRIPLRGIRSGATVEDSAGHALRLDFTSGLTSVHATPNLCLSGHLQELQTMGCTEFIIDLTGPAMNDRRRRDVLEAISLDRPIEGTSPFNFERGLE